jgi:hypothetical protein
MLDGIDLPDLVGMDRLADHGDDGAAVARPIDSGADEGELETADRGDLMVRGPLPELESDQPGAPGGVIPLEVAGAAEQVAGAIGDRTTAGAIVGGQSREVGPASEPHDVADGAIGDRQLGGDPGQGDALLMASHDLLADRDREGARHGVGLRSCRGSVQLLKPCDFTHAYERSHNFPAHRTVQTLQRVTSLPAG